VKPSKTAAAASDSRYKAEEQDIEMVSVSGIPASVDVEKAAAASEAAKADG